ncbi:MAG: hypothetical protein EYC62_02415 [Alphaproteobacteria bacterium]|nr:MAG: hypothetical protein EYC62_02415 [Alphaproteobacteria bacterium]
MNQQNLQKFQQILKTVNWRFVLKMTVVLATLIIFLVSLLFFLNDDTSQKDITEARLALRTSLSGLATFASDYDGDKVLEPPFASDLDGKVTDTIGYFIPPSINVKRHNAQKKPYVYCAWDYGAKTNPARYYMYKNEHGAAEILANPAPTAILMALVDPGPNGKYETRCENILTPKSSIGDDIVETFNRTETERLATQKTATPRKSNRNCAFGQIYIWNEVKQQWECKTPAAEQTASIPAGCPTGQVLVERSKKVRCEAIDKVDPEIAAEMSSAGSDSSISNSNVSSTVTDNTSKDKTKNQNLADNVVLPSAAGNNTDTGDTKTTNNEPNNTETTFVDQQPSRILTGQHNSSSGIQDPNTAVQQKIQNARNRKNLIVRTPSPGESINAAFEEDFNDDQDKGTISASGQKGSNLIAGQANQDGQTEESSVEMEIKKRKRNFKLKSCNPWLYLPRSTGVVNQCIRSNAFGDFFGNVARTTSWPAARTFLQGAFLFCPVGNYGEKRPCQLMAFDKNLFVTRTPPSVFNQDGYICARMFNPLPAPWPQFESFIYSESIPNGPRCRYDQVPFMDHSTNPPSIMCMNLPELIDAYNHNGYCGCGWSLIWNPSTSKLECS